MADVLLRHDLRQPLAAIAVLVEELSTASDLPPDAAQAVHLIRQNTHWMGQLLRSGAGSEQARVVDLADVAEAPCDERPPGVPWEVTFLRLGRAPVCVDPVGLERSVRNLLSNATRAVAAGGRVEVLVRSEEEHAVLEVADAGVGFGRLAPQHGHGLQGVRRFAERFGGTLSCGTSRLGGALVTLRLPLAFGW